MIRLDDLLCDGKVLPDEDVNVAVVVDLCHGLKSTRLQNPCQGKNGSRSGIRTQAKTFGMSRAESATLIGHGRGCGNCTRVSLFRRQVPRLLGQSPVLQNVDRYARIFLLLNAYIEHALSCTHRSGIRCYIRVFQNHERCTRSPFPHWSFLRDMDDIVLDTCLIPSIFYLPSNSTLCDRLFVNDQCDQFLNVP